MQEIIIGLIGSGGMAAIITAIINALSARKGIKSKLKKLEKDTVRLQLLFLMNITPEETQELMTVAEYYFVTLKADWYMTALFAKWLKTNKIERPNWFITTTVGGDEE